MQFHFTKVSNAIIQMGQMDIVVNFWDNLVNNECTHYLNSTFIGHVRYQDLFKHFISVLDLLHLKMLLQVSMDGPNVNWVFFPELCNYWTENGTSRLLSTGSCGVYSWSF